MLRMEKLTRRVGATLAVDGVCLEVPQGQMVGIIGRSGAGKSTLLRLIDRLLEPTHGTIWCKDSDITALKGRELRQWRARCAMIFQQFNLVNRLDVITLVAYMEHSLRVPLKMHQATDYAGTIEALKARKLEFARFAFMGTLLGTAGAFVLCFPATRNLTTKRWLYAICRRLLEIARTVPDLVYALIFVYAFGLGLLPGVLAIAVHSMGSLGKLFSEVNENIDMRPVEGVRASGVNWLQMLRYAVVPRVLPNFSSYTLLRFEINVRASSIVGFVGAGGIGQELYYVIRQFIYVDISAIVRLLILTVALIDITCERVRHRLIGEQVLT